MQKMQKRRKECEHGGTWGHSTKHGVDHTILPPGLLVNGLVALCLAIATHEKVAELGGACQDTLNGPEARSSFNVSLCPHV